MAINIFRLNEKGETTNLLISTWVDSKIKLREWEDLGISELKYSISFLPLYNLQYGDLKAYAKSIGMSHDVLRKFLSEKKIKTLARQHMDQFAEYFSNKIITLESRVGYGKTSFKKSSEKADMLFDELTAYADELFARITRKIFQMRRDLSADIGCKKLIAITSLYNRILHALKNKYKEKNKKLYLGFSIRYLQEVKLFHDAGLLSISEFTMKNAVVPEEIIQGLIKSSERMDEIINDMVESFINDK